MLTGVQHLPTLMLLNPTGALSDINLDEYTVLDCELLHDLKGHLIHLCKELPHLLTGETRKSCEDIISTTVSDKMTCADHRIVLLQLARRQQKHQRFARDSHTNVRNPLPARCPPHTTSSSSAVQLLVVSLCRELFTKVHAGQDVWQLLTCLSCTCPITVRSRFVAFHQHREPGANLQPS